MGKLIRECVLYVNLPRADVWSLIEYDIRSHLVKNSA